MILKEAFRYQNHLDNLIDMATLYLSNVYNITQKEQVHMRSKVNPDAQDETIIMPKQTLFDNGSIVPQTIVSFLMDLYEEKVKLTSAIAIAKKNAKIDIDACIALNKTRQKIASTYKYMSNVKSGEIKTIGSSTRFNAELNQVSYRYDVNEITTIDFDRNVVKALAKKLNNESDSVSADIDMANITVEVNYTPKYDLDDSFEDCILAFLHFDE